MASGGYTTLINQKDIYSGPYFISKRNPPDMGCSNSNGENLYIARGNSMKAHRTCKSQRGCASRECKICQFERWTGHLFLFLWFFFVVVVRHYGFLHFFFLKVLSATFHYLRIEQESCLMEANDKNEQLRFIATYLKRLAAISTVKIHLLNT